MDSFYGGKYGASYIIKKYYESVAAMTADFSQGALYKDVAYDEYVLINTVNKNDADNGKVFRRGYDHTNQLGGAVYVGTIVGPSGPAPMIESVEYDDIDLESLTVKVDDKITPIDSVEKYRSGEVELSKTAGNLVSGAEYNTIKYKWCSMRDNNGEDTTLYIGFQVPYTVIDFTSESVDPYYHRDKEDSADFINENLAVRIDKDEDERPFHESWHISVPKGIKGDSFKNFRVIPAAEVIEDYDDKADDIENSRQILVYDYYHYDKDGSGEPVSIYLGDYNMIKNVNFTEDGTITIDYSHDDADIFDKLIRWISSVSLDNAGNFTVKYNNGTADYTASLKWVNDIKIADNGTITLHYSNNAEPLVLDQKFKSINTITLNETGTVTIDYNTGDQEIFTNKIQWIDSIELTDAGVFTVKYNNGTADYVKNLIWVIDVEIADDGTVTVKYNNGTTSVYEEKIKWLKNIAVQTDGDQKLYATYNNNTTEVISEPLNYIKKVALNTENFHVLIYNSDPAIRQNLIDAGIAASHEGLDGWQDLGAIRDYSGILVGKQINQADIPVESGGVINYLNSEYPNGLLSDNLRGKLIVVSSLNNAELFYGFDYDNNTWFYAGQLGEVDPTEFILVGKNDVDNLNVFDTMPVGSIWFVEEG